MSITTERGARLVIEAAVPDAANLTPDQLQAAYAVDFTGDMGLRRAEYLGPHQDGGQYLVLVHDDQHDLWTVTHAFVTPNRDGVLALDFPGVPLFDSKDEAAAETFFAKEAHLRGGGGVKPRPKPRYNPNGDRPYQAPPGHVAWGYRRPSGGGSPHWDGNRYAL